jgi:hypothetical protein
MFFIGLALYGMANELLTIFFISPYREHFLKTFVFSWFIPLVRIVGLGCCITDNRVVEQPQTSTSAQVESQQL